MQPNKVYDEVIEFIASSSPREIFHVASARIHGSCHSVKTSIRTGRTPQVIMFYESTT